MDYGRGDAFPGLVSRVIPMEKRVLIVPGLRGSGPGHWQTLWESSSTGFRRVLQHDWLWPRLADWSAALDDAIRAEQRDVFIVAHGFGCLATLARLQKRSDDVLGVLLVAPRRPDEFELKITRLEIPAIVVASRTDAWLPYGEAEKLAHDLHARFVDAGDLGHIDGEWPKGEKVLQKLFDLAEAQERQLQVALTIAN
jgi:uncharacterized protein